MNDQPLDTFSVGDNFYGLFATGLTAPGARAEANKMRKDDPGSKPKVHREGSKPKPWWAWI